ncbi:hypothetical protein COCHEDRAFT_1182927 [Bipolaris maydis C5]|uniref:Uncharacterized protein n=1 Tax=Cochliobolus heterostrophus (strain C5 / ATCC 48332 / race O) TaxID=701091 RepID=M2TMY3_COCH5|nr:hypothetical protein COCHEDRAFT_1182927 [Bipolaris maydis C5]KAJ6206871.1 hypothetical protein PSV09DRAFT_1182927 [Bipolaris maydis]
MQGCIISMLLLLASIACTLLPVSGYLRDGETTLMAGASPASILATAMTPTSKLNVPFVTVQWVETFIGGTYSTWWPHTISIDFKPQRSAAPAPGRGEIGMGTLTGKTGQTQTVVEVVAAAATQDSGWTKGIAAMAGVGIMGIL